MTMEENTNDDRVPDDYLVVVDELSGMDDERRGWVSLSDFLDEKPIAEFQRRRPADPFNPPHPCRVMPTRHCPDLYGDVCGERPCARFESDDETPWLPEIRSSETEAPRG